MLKSVYDINLADLAKHPVWYFPMGDFREDQVSPVLKPRELDARMVLVRTRFEDQESEPYYGYLYWGYPEKISYLKPDIFVGDFKMSFYKALKPTTDAVGYAKSLFPKASWPIVFASEEHFGLKPITGSLEGLYYLGEDSEVHCYDVWE